jgi:hypothetical protein
MLQGSFRQLRCQVQRLALNRPAGAGPPPMTHVTDDVFPLCPNTP